MPRSEETFSQAQLVGSKTRPSFACNPIQVKQAMRQAWLFSFLTAAFLSAKTELCGQLFGNSKTSRMQTQTVEEEAPASFPATWTNKYDGAVVNWHPIWEDTPQEWFNFSRDVRHPRCREKDASGKRSKRITNMLPTHAWRCQESISFLNTSAYRDKSALDWCHRDCYPWPIPNQRACLHSSLSLSGSILSVETVTFKIPELDWLDGYRITPKQCSCPDDFFTHTFSFIRIFYKFAQPAFQIIGKEKKNAQQLHVCWDRPNKSVQVWI